MTTRPLAYRIESHQIGGHFRGFIIAKCSGCEQTHKVHWSGGHNPHHIATHLRRTGWAFHPYRQNGNKCPSCTKQLRLPAEPTNLNSLGGRIKHMRQRTSLTIQQLSTEAKIPEILLQQVEDGKHLRFGGLDQAIPIRLADVFARHGASVDANWLNGTGETTSELAINLRRLMRDRDHTEASLAAAAHVAPSLIRRILCGDIQECYSIDKIAGALSCRVETLTGKPTKPSPDDLFRKPDERKVRALPALPAPEQPLTASPEPHVNGAEHSHRGIDTIALANVFFGNPAQWLKDLRERHKLTQKTLAALVVAKGGRWTVNSTQAMISMIELGANITPAREELLELVHKAEPKKARRRVKDEAILSQPASNPDVVVPAATEAVNELQAELAKAQSDNTELSIMLQEMKQKLLEQIEPLDQMIQETHQRIEGIQQVVSALPVIPETPKTQAEHLHFRRNSWFFRRKVPPYAREIFGITEVCHNLKTTNKREALKRKKEFEHAFEIKLNEARAI